MRLYINLSKNKELIPFNYQHLLTGVVNKWIGENNNEHGKTSLYSFSWLQNTKSSKTGINLTADSYFFISAYEPRLIKTILKGILKDPEMFCGIYTKDVQIQETPSFKSEEHFVLSSPIFLKKKLNNNKSKHLDFTDEDFNTLLTNNLKHKLRLSNLPDNDVWVEWDQSYPNPKTKLINYKGIGNKTSLTPVIIKGSPEQVAFAWEVGLGNSTGIGFGSLK